MDKQVQATWRKRAYAAFSAHESRKGETADGGFDSDDEVMDLTGAPSSSAVAGSSAAAAAGESSFRTKLSAGRPYVVSRLSLSRARAGRSSSSSSSRKRPRGREAFRKLERAKKQRKMVKGEERKAASSRFSKRKKLMSKAGEQFESRAYGEGVGRANLADLEDHGELSDDADDDAAGAT